MKSLTFLIVLLLSTRGAFADPPAGTDPFVSSPHGSEAYSADIGEVVNVAITSIRARFIDAKGAPILGLGPDDLQIRVHGQEVPALAVDWYANAVAPDDRVDAPARTRPVRFASHTRHRVSTFGQLFVFFVQTGPRPEEHAESRVLAEALLDVRGLVARLKPDDLAAVVSYDGHLKLQQDFTRDHEAVVRALQRAARTRDVPKAEPAAGAVTLAPALGAAAEEKIGLELALERTAQALARLPGEKVTVFLGLEGYSFPQVRETAMQPIDPWGQEHRRPRKKQRLGQTAEMVRAVLALQEACASVFVLDNTRAGGLYRRNLESLARSTGGTYTGLRTARGGEVEQLARTISGYYVITVNPEAFPGPIPRKERVELSLKGRPAEVLTTPLWVATRGSF